MGTGMPEQTTLEQLVDLALDEDMVDFDDMMDDEY